MRLQKLHWMRKVNDGGFMQSVQLAVYSARRYRVGTASGRRRKAAHSLTHEADSLLSRHRLSLHSNAFLRSVTGAPSRDDQIEDWLHQETDNASCSPSYPWSVLALNALLGVGMRLKSS